MDYYSLTNCEILQKALEDSYDIQMKPQVKNQGTNSMPDIIAATETNKKYMKKKKSSGRKRAATLNLRAWDSRQVSFDGGQGNKWSRLGVHL